MPASSRTASPRNWVFTHEAMAKFRPAALRRTLRRLRSIALPIGDSQGTQIVGRIVRAECHGLFDLHHRILGKFRCCENELASGTMSPSSYSSLSNKIGKRSSSRLWISA
jgi:hypothetical protein